MVVVGGRPVEVCGKWRGAIGGGAVFFCDVVERSQVSWIGVVVVVVVAVVVVGGAMGGETVVKRTSRGPFQKRLFSKETVFCVGEPNAPLCTLKCAEPRYWYCC